MKFKQITSKKNEESIEKQLTRRKKSAMPASCPWFSEAQCRCTAETQFAVNSAFIMRAARETDNYKFRVILSWKVTDGFKCCKQYKGLLRMVTKTVRSTGALGYFTYVHQSLDTRHSKQGAEGPLSVMTFWTFCIWDFIKYFSLNSSYIWPN